MARGVALRTTGTRCRFRWNKLFFPNLPSGLAAVHSGTCGRSHRRFQGFRPPPTQFARGIALRTTRTQSRFRWNRLFFQTSLTIWPFYIAEPAAGSTAGSKDLTHLPRNLRAAVLGEHQEPAAGSVGTCHFCDTYCTISPFTVPPRSAIILLIKERGPKEKRGPQAWVIN